MFCGKCGKQLPDSAKFCDGCGSQLNAQSAQASHNTATASSSQQTAQTAQPAYAQPVYQQPQPTVQQNMYYGVQGNNNPPPMSLGQYILTFIISGIPLIGFIMLLVWAFSSDTNLNKKNFARAVLIIQLVSVILSIMIGVIAGASFAAIITSL